MLSREKSESDSVTTRWDSSFLRGREPWPLKKKRTWSPRAALAAMESRSFWMLALFAASAGRVGSPEEKRMVVCQLRMVRRWLKESKCWRKKGFSRGSREEPPMRAAYLDWAWAEWRK